MRYNALLLLVALVVGACHRSSKQEVSKIEYAQGACFGSCVPLAISIDSTLNYKYYADSSYSWSTPKHLIISYRGKVNRKMWNALLSKLDEIGYKSIDTSRKVRQIADIQHRELIIYWNNNRTRITVMGAKIDTLIKFIRNSYQLIKLQPSLDTLNFGTTLQLRPIRSKE